MKLKILFRCEFGIHYGFGHLMRCIALSQAFSKYKNLEIFCFSMSALDGFDELLKAANMNYVKLPKKAVGLSFNPNNYVKLTNRYITIFDNYDVTKNQMTAYKKQFPNLVAIDDLADRFFNVDIIINQNLGSDKLVYNSINVPKIYTGEKYALLRKNILSAIPGKGKKNIFMSFGGGEVFERINILLNIMLTIDKELDEKITIDFVLSEGNKSQIKKILLMFENIKFNFIENKLDLSKYFKRADFAITAAGSTVFELAYLGIPQIVFVIDKNQKINGEKINEMGLGVCLGNINNLDKKIFSQTFNSFLYDSKMKKNISNKAKLIIDGRGAQRISDSILKYYNYA